MRSDIKRSTEAQDEKCNAMDQIRRLREIVELVESESVASGLSALLEAPNSSVAELAHHARISRGAASKCLRELAQRGWLGSCTRAALVGEDQVFWIAADDHQIANFYGERLAQLLMRVAGQAEARRAETWLGR